MKLLIAIARDLRKKLLADASYKGSARVHSRNLVRLQQSGTFMYCSLLLFLSLACKFRRAPMAGFSVDAWFVWAKEKFAATLKYLQGAPRFASSVALGDSQPLMRELRLATIKYEKDISHLLSTLRNDLSCEEIEYLVVTFQKEFVSQIQEVVNALNNGMRCNTFKSEIHALLIALRMKGIKDSVADFKQSVERQILSSSRASCSEVSSVEVDQDEEKVKVNLVKNINWKAYDAPNNVDSSFVRGAMLEDACAMSLEGSSNN